MNDGINDLYREAVSDAEFVKAARLAHPLVTWAPSSIVLHKALDRLERANAEVERSQSQRDYARKSMKALHEEGSILREGNIALNERIAALEASNAELRREGQRQLKGWYEERETSAKLRAQLASLSSPWIEVTPNTTPEDDTEYWFTARSGLVRRGIFVDGHRFLGVELSEGEGFAYLLREVTHYMPIRIPSPPEVESK